MDLEHIGRAELLPCPQDDLRQRFRFCSISCQRHGKYAPSYYRVCSSREIYHVSVMQLRAFYTLYQVMLRKKGIEIDTFKSRADEMFFRFRQLLSQHYRPSRSVNFYADKLCITPRYLININIELNKCNFKMFRAFYFLQSSHFVPL